MVAITVILAAVIAAFAFQMTGSIEAPKNVGLTAKQISDDKLQVTVQGGGDLSTLQYLRIEVVKGDDGGASKTYYAYVENSEKKFDEDTGTYTLPDDDDLGAITAGSIFTSDTSILTSGSDQVTITGHFMDGREYMLLNTFL